MIMTSNRPATLNALCPVLNADSSSSAAIQPTSNNTNEEDDQEQLLLNMDADEAGYQSAFVRLASIAKRQEADPCKHVPQSAVEYFSGQMAAHRALIQVSIFLYIFLYKCV